MILITVALWLAALSATAGGVAFYRWARVPRVRHWLHMALVVPASIAISILAAAGRGWALGLPWGLLCLSALLLMLAFQSKVDSLVVKWTDETFARRPDLRERFEKNPILRRVMRMRDWTRRWWA